MQVFKIIGLFIRNYIELIFSGFSACGAIFGVLGGRLADAHPTRTKGFVIFANGAMIIGNLIYLSGGSVVNLIIGRVICGKLLIQISRKSVDLERNLHLKYYI